MRRLTEKQQRFVDAFTGPAEGNATRAAEIAGYSHAKTQGPRLLENVGVTEAIAEATREIRSKRIADRQERQEWLTAVMRGELTAVEMTRTGDAVEVPPPWKERVKANELLGKMAGDFVERREHKVEGDGLSVQIYLPDNGRDAPRDPS